MALRLQQCEWTIQLLLCVLTMWDNVWEEPSIFKHAVLLCQCLCLCLCSHGCLTGVDAYILSGNTDNFNTLFMRASQKWKLTIGGVQAELRRCETGSVPMLLLLASQRRE